MKKIMFVFIMALLCLTVATAKENKFVKEHLETEKLEMTYFVDPQGTFNSATITMDITEKATGREAHCDILIPLWEEKPYPASLYAIIFDTSYKSKSVTSIDFNPHKSSRKRLREFLAENIVFLEKSVEWKNDNRKNSEK